MASTHAHPPAHPPQGGGHAGAAHTGDHGHVGSGLDPETGHVHPHVVTLTPAEVTHDIIAATERKGAAYRTAFMITGLLLLVGIAGFVWQAAVEGFDTFSPWAYFMATYAFLVATGSSAPMLSIGQRMLRSHWRRPVTRASELFTVVGILSTLMFIPLVLLLPPTGHMAPVAEAGPCSPGLAQLSGLPWAGDGCQVIDRPSIWWGTWGSPHLFDILAVVGLAVTGLMLLIVSAWPDLATYRRTATGGKKAWLGTLTLGLEWTGTEKQWAVQRGAIHILGALYFFMLVFVHTIIISDFGMSLVPRWVDSIMPATQAVNGFQAGLACVIIASYCMWRWGGMRNYIALDQFWASAKLLLAFSLLWFYFWFSGFIIYWYGRQPGEIGVLGTLMFQSYRTPFVLAFMLCFIAPFLILIWNGVRKSMIGPVIASVVILFGAFFDKTRIYTAAFHTADLQQDALTSAHPDPILVSELPRMLVPGLPDIMMIVGFIGGAVFFYLAALRIFPPVSIWHIQEGMLYRKMVPYLKTHILLMGKPE